MHAQVMPVRSPPSLTFALLACMHVQAALITRMLDEGMERAAGYGPINEKER